MSGITGGPIRDLIARIGVVVNTFDDLIDHGKAVQGLGFGLVDEFEDETGVDVAASTNEKYDAAADFYHNAGEVTLGAITEAKAGANSFGWGNGTAKQTYVGIQFTPAANGIVLEALLDADVVPSTQAGHAEVWTDVAGSPGGQVGVDSDTIANILVGENTFTFPTPPSVTNGVTYWIVFQANNNVDVKLATIADGDNTYKDGQNDLITTIVDGGQVDANEALRLGVKVSGGVPVDMTLIANAQVAGVAPAKAQFTALLEAVDPVTLNIDCKAYVSSNGGTTWNQATLKDFGDHGSGIAVVSGEAALTGGGTSMKWKFETLNAKEQWLRAVGVLWD